MSLSDLLVPLGLAIVLTTSVSIAKEHPLQNVSFETGIDSSQAVVQTTQTQSLSPTTSLQDTQNK
jgi:hypothetical protein